RGPTFPPPSCPGPGPPAVARGGSVWPHRPRLAWLSPPFHARPRRRLASRRIASLWQEPCLRELTAGRGRRRHAFCSRLRTVFLGRFQLRQVERTVDQGKVRERLRKVADEATRARVIFLAHQSDVVAQIE